MNTETGGSWFALPGATNAIAGDDMQVLIAQFTSEDCLHGVLHALILPADGSPAFVLGQQFNCTECGPIGCADETACNYNPDAPNYPGGNANCTYADDGYDCDGNCLLDSDLDGICDPFEVAGCTDVSALNFDPNATDEDGYCAYAEDLNCADEAACKYQRDTKLGSSTKWMNPRHLSNAMYQLASGDAVENPALYGAHRVYLPYCTQDLWSGSSPKAGEWGLHFGGRLIIDAVIDALMPTGLADATTVVLTGASAGGIGVWINVDHLQSRLPHARVIGAPIAGFYAFAYPYTGAHHTSSTLADFREGLSDAETNSVRFARLSPGKCRKSARWLLCQSRLSTIPARSLWPTQSGFLRESVEIAAGRAPSSWRSASKVERLVEVPTKGAGGCQTLRWVSSISAWRALASKELLQNRDFFTRFIHTASPPASPSPEPSPSESDKALAEIIGPPVGPVDILGDRQAEQAHPDPRPLEFT